MLCLDQITFDELRRRNLPGVKLVPLDELERATEGLASARANRSQIEFYYTCSPALPLFIIKSDPAIDLITYLDADLYFYADPELVFEELGTKSVGIIRHRLAPELAHEERYSIYNVGWVTFRRDEAGLACLTWWCERCIEWCYLRLEEGRYADQKYLDYFPARFPNVVVLEHEGANLAPWNITNYRIGRVEGQITVNGQPLVFFHFSGFQQINRLLYATGVGAYNLRVKRKVMHIICLPYIRTLLDLSRDAAIPQGLIHGRRSAGPRWKQWLRPVKEYLRGDRIIYLFGRVF